MSMTLTRRAVLASAFAARGVRSAEREIVETHLHLFAGDQARFPFHPNAPYRPPSAHPVEDYVRFAPAAGITHVVIVHPEPYQDDHRYLEYCFTKEPSPGYFKGTCLFDPAAPATPDRISELVKRNPKRIVGMRMHEMGETATGGAIKNRDLRSAEMRATWRRLTELGLAVQIQFLPQFAPQIGELAGQFRETAVILDHMGRPGQGRPGEFDGVLKLARAPRVYFKVSEIGAASKQPFPHADAKPLVRRAFDAFGPERLIWGELGYDKSAFDKSMTLFEAHFDFASASDKARILGGNAAKLFGWA
jgi:predicted TIM-barrel fold metal-dependent hydrolase